jgi:hypothetical protein
MFTTLVPIALAASTVLLLGSMGFAVRAALHHRRTRDSEDDSPPSSYLLPILVPEILDDDLAELHTHSAMLEEEMRTGASGGSACTGGAVLREARRAIVTLQMARHAADELGAYAAQRAGSSSSELEHVRERIVSILVELERAGGRSLDGARLEAWRKTLRELRGELE